MYKDSSSHYKHHLGRGTSWILVLALCFLLTSCSFGKKPPAAAEPAAPSETETDPHLLEPEPEPEPTLPEPELPGAFVVVIENHPNSRPQFGLELADVVYEVDAIYGISRFLAVYYHYAPEQIGPVRSARQYLVDIARAYPGPFVHVGGNVDSLNSIRELRRQGFQDMDEITNSGQYFWRGKDRKAPHNVYTSSERILQAVADRSWTLQPPPEVQFGEMEGGRPVTELTIDFKGGGAGRNTVMYRYVDGRYQRYINDEPHNTAAGEHLAVDNIAVIYTTSKVIHPHDPSLDIPVTGEGKAVFFSRGQVWEGTWQRGKVTDPFRYIVDGKDMQFTLGNLWVEIVTPPHVLTYETEDAEEQEEKEGSVTNN